MRNEADTCRTYVVPALHAAGWTDDQIAEQYYFTDGRIIVAGRHERRGERNFADYLLRYQPDFPIAIVEAKAEYKRATDGLGQAKEYADILGLSFAYASNGPEIVEFDALTGLTTPVGAGGFSHVGPRQRRRRSPARGDGALDRRALLRCLNGQSRA